MIWLALVAVGIAAFLVFVYRDSRRREKQADVDWRRRTSMREGARKERRERRRRLGLPDDEERCP